MGWIIPVRGPDWKNALLVFNTSQVLVVGHLGIESFIGKHFGH